MLGAVPVVDYCLADRLLLFDLVRQTWSPELLSLPGLDREKLPATARSGTAVMASSPAPEEPSRGQAPGQALGLVEIM